ncbi:MAG: hypothetical protein SP4CHLAM5_05710 [Chlamydiia bacterium]|nr:hypothetical protein [Chlamydiia bacterium]MCH9618441.1 hypothetical protein [Chlamydiia bacterium]MCH9623767.1 hypothetical protein [Chlamydiia bacterium]
MSLGSVSTKVKVSGDATEVLLLPKKASYPKEIGMAFCSPRILSALPGVIANLAQAIGSPQLKSLATNSSVIKNAKNLEILAAGTSILAVPFKIQGLYTAYTARQKSDSKNKNMVFAHEVADKAGSLLSALKNADKYVAGFTVPEKTKPYLAALKEVSTSVKGFTTLYMSGPRLWNDDKKAFTLKLKILIAKVTAATAEMTVALFKLAERVGVKNSRPLISKGLKVIGALAQITSLMIRILESHQKIVEAEKAKGVYVQKARVATQTKAIRSEPIHVGVSEEFTSDSDDDDSA